LRQHNNIDLRIHFHSPSPPKLTPDPNLESALLEWNERARRCCGSNDRIVMQADTLRAGGYEEEAKSIM
jgi:hypothetical protein